MILTVEGFSDQVQRLLQDARASQREINARIAKTALSLVRDRVINTGIDANGNSFGKYSTNELPGFWFVGKGLSKGADTKLASELKKQRKAGNKRPGISYEKWRDMNNLQTDHKDFKFTGDTWKDIDVLETQISGWKAITEIASKDSITKKQGNGSLSTGQLTEYLGQKYGNFLASNNQENELMNQVLEDEVQQLIDQYFPV